MSKTLISDSEYLFALCITYGMLEELGEAQRASLLFSITQTLRRNCPQTATEQNPKYQSKGKHHF